MHRSCFVACIVGFGAPVVAQPLAPTETPTPPPAEQPMPQPTPAPPATDEVIDLDAPDRAGRPQRAPAPAPASPERFVDAPARPDHLSVGIGAGYTLPADFTVVNAASVRLRFPSGLILEPIVDVHTTRSSSEVMGVEAEQTANEVSLAALGRLPLGSRGPVDLVGVAGAGVSHSTTNPEGNDNDSGTTEVAVVWGLGLDYWISERWALSATASNPLFALSRTSAEQLGGDDATATTFRLGATFDPTVVVMGHLFF